MVNYLKPSTSETLEVSAEKNNEYCLQTALSDKETKNKLVKDNFKLVYYILKLFKGINIDYEELVSIGNVGLVKAAYSYDSNKNIKFATYASTCIRNEILMALRRSKKDQNCISLNAVVSSTSEGNQLLYEDIIGTEFEITDSIIKIVEQEEIKEALSILDSNEKKVIELNMGFNSNEPLTQKEIAIYLNVSQPQISRIKIRALKKMRAYLTKHSDNNEFMDVKCNQLKKTKNLF